MTTTRRGTESTSGTTETNTKCKNKSNNDTINEIQISCVPKLAEDTVSELKTLSQVRLDKKAMNRFEQILV